MSTMYWQGNRIIQGVSGESSELGYVGFDDNSKSYVLWLKDHEGMFINVGSYIRGDEWATEEEAKGRAMQSVSARLAHLAWMKQASKISKSNKGSEALNNMKDVPNQNNVVNVSVVNHISNQENHYNMEVNDNGVGFQFLLNIKKDDVEGFVRELTNNGMPESDAKEIAEIISQEKPESSTMPFGKKTMSWIVEHASKVSTSVGVNLLTEAVKKFYGFDS